MRFVTAALVVLAVGCARMQAETSVYGTEKVRPDGSFGIRILAAPEQRVLAFQEELAFALRDRSLRVARPDEAVYTLIITPTIREQGCIQTCNVIESLSIAVIRSEDAQNPLARIRLANAKGGLATTNDAAFARRAADEVVKLVKR